MKIVTGNDLRTGAVTWWTGSDWSLHVEDAADAGDQAEEIAAREDAARRVNNPYVINGERTEGGVRPAHIKDRIRASGPTVRPDLALKPADPDAGNWVI
ncbi:MAG: DUF2849 domain-containing protein [Tsuneonella sp.]